MSTSELTLVERVEQLERELIEHATATVLEVEKVKRELLNLADKTAQGLAHLAVAIVGLQRPTLLQRVRVWWQTHVHGTPHTENDERPL